MKNVRVSKKAIFDFDDPIKVSIDYYGEPRHFEVTGGELVTSDDQADQTWLRGYELTKTGKRRKNSIVSSLYIPNEVGIMVDGEYQWFTTPAVGLLETVRTLGLSLIYPKVEV